MARTFEQAVAILARAVSEQRPSALAPLTDASGIRFVFAPEDQPQPAQSLTPARLNELDALVQQKLDGGLPGWEPLHYLVEVFSTDALGDPDPVKKRVPGFPCDYCDLQFRFAERDGRWVIDMIYAADYEP